MDRSTWLGLAVAGVSCGFGFDLELGSSWDRACGPRSAEAMLVERPSLGIRVTPVTDVARREHGITVRRGALVVEVVPGGAFANAELAPGIVVVAADGRRIDAPQDLSEFVRATRVGQEIEITYYEREQLRKKRVRVGTGEVAVETDERVKPDALPSPDRTLIPARPTAERVAPERVVPDGTTAPRSEAASKAPAERGQPLKRLERVLEGLSRPAPDGPVPATARDVDLRLELGELREEVTELRRRVRELERRLELLLRREGGDDPDDVRPGLIEPDLKPSKKVTPVDEPKLELKPARE